MGLERTDPEGAPGALAPSVLSSPGLGPLGSRPREGRVTPRVGSISYVALGGLSEPQFSEESWKNNTIFPDCEAPRLVTRVCLTQ